MLPFLWTFGFLGFLIVCGICLSLSLYKQGVFGPRGYGRTRRDAEAARYARHGLLVFLGGIIVVVTLLSSLLSAVLH